MTELMITKEMIIDDQESVLEGLQNLASAPIRDLGAAIKFIKEEKNTKFYLDDRFNCKMQDERGIVYAWLDTGFVDNRNNPIFISLIKKDGVFRGHFVGTLGMLSNTVKEFFSYNMRVINENIKSFRSKYEKKAQSRVYKHIEDETGYLVIKCNEDVCEEGSMASLIKGLNAEFAPDPVEEVIEEPISEEVPEMDSFGEEITISLLMDKIESMESYIDGLLAKIEEMNQKYDAKDADIESLIAQRDEYKRAMVEVRTYMAAEESEMARRLEEAKDESLIGHELLGDKKILVLGESEISQNIMKGIAKNYGFENKDFDFVMDYTKVVNYAGRIQNSKRYYAVIFGSCPHKVAKLGDYSSIIEKFKQCEDQPFCADARSASGELKVSKASFRNALNEICMNMGMQMPA